MISRAKHQMHKPLLHLRFSRSPITYRQTLIEIVDSWYFFVKNRSAIFSRQVDVRSHSANTEAHQAGSWAWHFRMQEGDFSRKPGTELRL